MQNDQEQQVRLPCPNCGIQVQVVVAHLIYAQTIRCDACGVELALDKERSGSALDALRGRMNGGGQH